MHIHQHHPLTVFIQFVPLPAALLHLRHSPSCHQPPSGFPDFPTSAAAVAGQFSRRVHETLILPAPRPALSALTETLPWWLWRRPVASRCRTSKETESVFEGRKRGELARLQPNCVYQTHIILPISTPNHFLRSPPSKPVTGPSQGQDISLIAQLRFHPGHQWLATIPMPLLPCQHQARSCSLVATSS
jgi:hypothetical protein